jgi:hypothetical protein
VSLDSEDRHLTAKDLVVKSFGDMPHIKRKITVNMRRVWS